MNWKASPPNIEIAIVSIAAACLGGAVGFAVMRIAPVGAGLVEASVAGVFAALAGWALIGRVDRRRGLRVMAVARLDGGANDEDVLLLQQRVEEEALLRDESLPVLSDDMRVVRLFASDPAGMAAAEPLAGPAEMIARIDSFLGQPRGTAAFSETARASQAASEDASAALHVALADIRRSLRQA